MKNSNQTPINPQNIIVIGAGFAGLAAASFLAKAGHKVTILEKHTQAGGRARTLEAQGFSFDMGPSWYWMPDVFERFFNAFGKSASDYYDLQRLDPSYAVYFGKETKDIWQIPTDLDDLCRLFEEKEAGSSQFLRKFLDEAAYKYQVGIQDLVYKPSLSIWEFVDMRLLKGLFNLNLFQSFHSYVRRYFKNPQLIQLLEFPVLFLGGRPKDTPALYSLMNYADMMLGTWYPKGGMHKIIEGMVAVAKSQNVDFQLGTNVEKIIIDENNRATKVQTDQGIFEADIIVGAADYQHIDQKLLPESHRNYSPKYWDSRKMSPSSLLYYIGINKKLKGLLHHNLFFDSSFERHANEIYSVPQWPGNPLFYVSCTSQTDPTTAPEGMENVFILIPIAAGLEDTKTVRDYYFGVVIKRLEELTGQSIAPHIVFKKSYAPTNFTQDYNAFKGNAYGLANTLMQTAILKPSIKSKKVDNLYFTGQLTVPGPGVPPSLISGQVVAKQVLKELNRS